MHDLSSYAFSPLRDGDLALYRGAGAGLPPILLVAAENGSRAALRRLEHEYEIATQLDAAGAATPLSLTHHEGRTVLILGDPGGEPLARVLERNPGQPLDLTRFLRIAIPLATALRRVHEHGLIHKDIKPANILVDEVSGGVRLMGFGISSRLRRERQEPEPPEVIAGTLAYMAPEQTGRMNRSIDARSDLYSLGVTLYQMLTGQLPFTAADPLEWVHCHIARQPTSPGDRAGVCEPLSSLVMKLLAKSAEERYQTAAGVAADLRRCLVEWESNGRIDPFPLGKRDMSDRLLIPEKLYGREREIDALRASFERVVATGLPELVLVSGYSGIGKSSVVNELHRVLIQPRGLYASGKFDQYKRDIPYVTLAQAFQSLVRSLLSQGDAELGRWRDSLSEALGSNGLLMVNLVPELELIIGKQPTVPDLPPQEAKNRFQMVFRRFLSVFARKEHPLALFLDDLQWLDPATLELLEQLVTHPEVRHLLLVGAYRDNEVGLAHPLIRTFEVIRNAGTRVEEVVLTPLGLDDIRRLVTDALRCQSEHALPLAQLVHNKTSGNPFFAIQFLTAMSEGGLLVFDPVAPDWRWDIDRIRARSYTDNVADLLVEKMMRLSVLAQEAMKQLACLGNVAPTSNLALVHGDTEEAMHAALWEAVQAGLVFREDGVYKFLHDRIQQAAYSLIPEERRVEAHLRIGRVLLANMMADELAEHLFDVANQLNRGAARLIDREEKAQVAAIDLSAGRKAKTSAAYASARAYFSAGIALLDERDWDSHYDLSFSLRLERAECEFLTGDFEAAEQLIADLVCRGSSKVDQAAAYHLRVLLHTVKSENVLAVASALTCLRLFGIDLPEHPSWEQVRAEYETVWHTLNGRPIETLIDVPLMTDVELQAAMRVLSTLLTSAYVTDFHLFCLHLCRMVNISMLHGMCSASAHGCGWLGTILGSVFHRYGESYRFARLACELVDKHGFVASRAKTHFTMGIVALWTQPMTTAIDFMRAAFRAATESGDLTYACYSIDHTIANLLVRNDPLDVVWRESEMALNFARQARYGDVVDIIVSQQRFVATLQGRSSQFDERAFEEQLTKDRTATMVCFYWILKLKARFLSGDYAQALAAADQAKSLLFAVAAQIQLLDYFYYTALTVAALYEDASADEQADWRELLTAHREQLREWAETYPPTFSDKHALASAEFARIEGRDADAMRLYQQAIHSAREHGFVQNEGVAHEVAARFYTARGVDRIGHVCLRNARDCYLRWGALAKVRQLDQRHPGLCEESVPSVLNATIDASVEQLDLGTVIKSSQAVSSEIELSKLIATLMRISLEHAGAERGLLILLTGDEPRIAAEATTGGGNIEVRQRNSAVTPTELMESVLHTALHTYESVILDDAATRIPFSADVSTRQKRARSVLCLPLVKQGKIVGALYLENNLTPRVFTSTKLAVLELLASQAAISLENVRLYDELRSENSERRRAEAGLRRSEAYLSEAQRLSHTGSFGWRPSSGELYWADETYRIFEYEPGTTPTLEWLTLRIHPDDVAAFGQVAERASQDGQDFAHEYRLRMPDERVKQIHVMAHAFRDETGDVEFIGAVMDVTAIRVAERELHKTRTDLAHVMRVTSLGELTASIAHEVNQPLGAVMFNVEACQSWLAADPPNMKEAHAALERIVRDGTRASEVIRRIRTVAKKTDTKMAPLNLNDVLSEALTFVQHELLSSGVVVRLEHASALPIILADKVQLQQVILNLLINGIEAMHSITDRPRELTIRSEQDAGHVRVTVTDCGVGFSAASEGRLFNTFFTTKSAGMGMGLSICRSIVELHGGRIWATPHVPHGATIQFTLPLQRAEASDRTSPQPPISARWRL